MAVRVTAAEVKEILLQDYDSRKNPSLDPFIVAASSLVDQVVQRASQKGKALTADTAKLVETWLAAHVYCCNDQPYSSRSNNGASGSFQGQTGMNLDGTKYGQMAQLLDPSGELVATSKRAKVVGVWLGTPRIDQRDYHEREM